MGEKFTRQAKKLAVRALAFIFRNERIFGRLLLPFVKILGLFWLVARKTLFFGALPVYKVYLTAKRIFNRFYSPFVKKHNLIHPFSRRYLPHIIIVVISLFVVTTNLNAYEVKRDDLTYSNVFTAIISPEDLGSIEEDSLLPQSNKVTRYIGTTGVESKPQATGITTPDTSELAVSTGALVKPILSPTEAELRKRDKIVYHVVQGGETVSEIAQSYGVTVNTLLWENNLTAYSIIRPGQSLAILPASGVNHKVARGDTIISIAKKYKVEPEDIIEYNRLASADDINIGERLLIPGGAPPPPPQSYTVRSFTAPKPQAVASSGKYSWPAICHRITQYFNTWRHKGVDIACSFGSPVKASLSGTVIRASGGWNGGYGLVVIVDHGSTQTLYAHLSKIYVRVGDQITAGQAVGAMGSTGRSTGSHVHFEVRSSGYTQNPLNYL